MIFSIEGEGQNQSIVIRDNSIGDRSYMGLLSPREDDLIVGRVHMNKDNNGIHSITVTIPLGDVQEELREGHTIKHVSRAIFGSDGDLEGLRERCAQEASKFMYNAVHGAILGIAGEDEELAKAYEYLAVRAAQTTLEGMRKIPLEESDAESTRETPEQEETSQTISPGPEGGTGGTGRKAGRRARQLVVVFNPLAGLKQDNENQGPGNRTAGTNGPETEG